MFLSPSATSLLARRYLWSRQRDGMVSITAVFAFLGIALGVATLIIVLSVMDGFRTELIRKILSFQGHIVVHTLKKEGIQKYEALQKEILTLPSVESATPLLERQSILLHKGLAQGVMMRGVSADDLKKRFPVLKAGSMEGFDAGEGVILGYKLAQKLYVDVGDHVTLVSPESNQTAFGPIYPMRPMKVVGLFDAGMFTYDSGVAFMPLVHAQGFYRLPQAVTSMEITLHNPDESLDITKLLMKRLPPQYRLTDWQQSNSTYMAALQVERNVMFLVLSLIILIASFNIITGMTFLVKDKARDIAFLRSQGASRRMIYSVFYRISLVIGMLGVVCGIGLGILITLNLETLRLWIQKMTGAQLFAPELYYLSQLPAVLSWKDVGHVSLFTFLLVGCSAIYPAWKASSLNPLAILRNG